jgi:hypothetical protein
MVKQAGWRNTFKRGKDFRILLGELLDFGRELEEGFFVSVFFILCCLESLIGSFGRVERGWEMFEELAEDDAATAAGILVFLLEDAFEAISRNVFDYGFRRASG